MASVIGRDSHHRVIIIGAGPSGAAAAVRLAQRGVRGVVMVDKDVFPREKTCGSALSPGGVRLLDDLGVGAEVRRRGYRVQALRIVTPGNREVRLTTEQGVIFPRRDLDNLLVEEARGLGVEFRSGWRASGLLREGSRVVGVRGRDGELRGDYVLAADGAHAIFSPDPRPRRTISTLMGFWEGVAFAPGTIEMIFDKDLAPLYGWIFPESATRVSIGICIDGEEPDGRKTRRNVREVFERFLRTHLVERLRGASQIGKLKGHPISYTTWARHCGAAGILQLGEAARLTHNATGEGIYQAMQSGVYAADAVADVVAGNRSEQSAWRQYTWRCRRRFTLAFAAGHLMRAVLRTPVCELLADVYNGPGRWLATRAVDSALRPVA